MCKEIKYIILFLILLVCTSFGGEYYENVVPGLPIGGGKSIGGLYKKTKPKCSHKISPVDNVKEELTVEAYNKVSKGIGILVIAFIVSIAFSNPITHSIANIGMGIGGGWALLGLIKLFVASYLLYFCIGAFFLILIAVVLRLRGKSVLNAKKWFKEIKQYKL